jgi:hypothetical protein
MQKTAIFSRSDAFYDNCLGSPLTPGCHPVGARPSDVKELKLPDDLFGGKLGVRF